MQDIQLKLSTGLTLHGLQWNQDAPIKVLALHGWLDNANSFLPMAAHLPDSIQLVALDQVGHGLSDHRPAGQWYHFVDYLRDAAFAADALGWQRFHLLGHSLGGAICCSLAVAAPERIQSLSIIEGLGPLGGDPQLAGERLHDAWQGLIAAPESKKRRHQSIEMATKARLMTNQMLPASAKLLVERGLKQVKDGYIWRTDRRLRLTSPTRLTETEVLFLLKQIECPVFQVLPDPLSPFIPEAIMQRRIACLKNYQQLQLSGYHHLHMDQPEPCATAIFDFIRTQKDTAQHDS